MLQRTDSKILVLTLSLLFFSVKVFASLPTIDELILLADQHFQQGRWSQALEQYSKALLMSPNQEEVRQHIKAIAREFKNQGRPQDIEILQFLDLVDYSQFLKSRFSNYLADNELTLEFILTNGVMLDSIQSEARQIQERMLKDLNRFKNFQDMLSEKQSSMGFDLTKLNSDLRWQKERFLDHILELQKYNRELRSLKIEVMRFFQKNQRQTREENYETQLSEMRSHLGNKEAALKRQDENYRGLKEELAKVKQSFLGVKDQFKETDQKIAELTRDLAGMTLELYAKDKQLVDKGERIEKLGKDLGDTEERLTLVQHLIEEKDQKMMELEQKMTSAQEQTGKEAVLGETKGKLLRKEISELYGKLKTQSKASLAKVDILERRLQELSQRYSEISKNLEQRDVKVAELEEGLRVRDLQVSELKNVFVSKDKKLFELNGVVEIYKGKLHDAFAMLEDKDAHLNKLEQEVDGLKRRVEKLRQSALRDISQDYSMPVLDSSHGLTTFEDVKDLTPEQILKRTKHELGALQIQLHD